MIETNTIVELQFYPDTPIGFYRVYYCDLDAALDEAYCALVYSPVNERPMSNQNV